MKNYPTYIATKQDFLNLLSLQEFRDRALSDLRVVYDDKDDYITIDDTPSDAPIDAARNVRITSNPLPKWRLRGFDSRADVLNMINSCYD